MGLLKKAGRICGVIRCSWRFAAMAGVMAFTASTGASHSAEIETVSLLYSQSYPVPHIRLSGVILPGDADKLKAAIDAAPCLSQTCDEYFSTGSQAVVTLDSPGGHFLTGIDLAEIIREHAVATVVPSGARCFSACALAFLGGSGFWPTGGVGYYADRAVEPGGELGFHSPYLPRSVLDTVTNGELAGIAVEQTRISISTMVRVLTDYGVDLSVIDTIIGMGPEQSWTADTPGALYALGARLPPIPASTLDVTRPEILRRGCLYLLARHYGGLPGEELMQFMEPVADWDVSEDGLPLDGYGIMDRPADLAFCGAGREAQDEVPSPALYAYDAVELKPVFLMGLVHAGLDGGWSSLDADAGQAKTAVLSLHGLAHLMLPPDAPLSDLPEAALDFIADDKFGANALPALPGLDFDKGAELSGPGVAVYSIEGGHAYVQTGSARLFDLAQSIDVRLGADVTYAIDDGETGFVRSGFYPLDAGIFYRFALRAGEDALLVSLEFNGDRASGLSAEQKALTAQIACSARFEGVTLPCGR